jgi:hypothetical protein
MLYEAHHGHFPPAYIKGPYAPPGITGVKDWPWHSWRVLILPFLGEEKLYAEYRLDEPYFGANNKKLLTKMPAVYAYRDSHKPGMTETQYFVPRGEETMWPYTKCRKRDEIRDPFDQTVLLYEMKGGCPWTHWEVGALTVDRPYGWWPDPEVITLAGTVHRLRRGMSWEAARAATSVDGGELLEECEVGWRLPGEDGLPKL